ncbi:MAG: sugar phosphate isomerase/epimerase [Clostridia bacterium]|nr:sugar phosphate isomerase/epimerase [Clostridia bacterium]
MYQFPIGVMLDSFRLDAYGAIKKAAELGAKGLQMYATTGEFAPENMNTQKKRELLDMLKSNGLVFSALCGDLGRGFGNRELNPELIEKSKRILDLAKELETDIVTTHIGVVPADPNHDRYKIMQEACFELARYADSLHAHFAIETGPEIATTLKGFLDTLHSKGVAVNFDPANFVMVTGDDPVQAVYTLKDYIVHTHAKDGRKLKDCNPEVVYRIIDEEANQGITYIELPLGEGDVDFDNYLKALDEIGYRGFLTIEREVGENPAADIALAADFLRSKLK